MIDVDVERLTQNSNSETNKLPQPEFPNNRFFLTRLFQNKDQKLIAACYVSAGCSRFFWGCCGRLFQRIR